MNSSDALFSVLKRELSAELPQMRSVFERGDRAQCLKSAEFLAHSGALFHISWLEECGAKMHRFLARYPQDNIGGILSLHRERLGALFDFLAELIALPWNELQAWEQRGGDLLGFLDEPSGVEVPDPKMHALFSEEITRCCGELSALLMTFESSPQDLEPLDGVMRLCHALKGASRSVQLAPLVTLAHGMEEFTLGWKNRERAPSSKEITLMLQCVDLFQAIGSADPMHWGEWMCKAEQLTLHLQTTRTGSSPETPPPLTTIPSEASATESRVLHLPLEVVEEVVGLAGEMLVYFHTFAERLKEWGHLGVCAPTPLLELRERIFDGEALLDKLYARLMQQRMCSFGDVAHGMPRLVRDLAHHLGKEVRLRIEGTTLMVDRDLVVGIQESLGHLLRNALDHGIEPPEQRERAGKPKQGDLLLKASHTAHRLLIVLRDDGKGIGSESGSLDQWIAQNVRPGTSEPHQATEVSGRGVGLYGVQNFLKRVGGLLEGKSIPGHGVEWVLNLPLAISVASVLVVRQSEWLYGFPLSTLQRVAHLEEPLAACERTWEGHQISVFREIVGGAGTPHQDGYLIIFTGPSRRALLVHEVLGEEEVFLQKQEGFLGSVRDDGTIVMILDPSDLFSRAIVQTEHIAG